MKKTIQYQVWQVGGGYFQSFKKYGEAVDLRNHLQSEFPKSRFTIIEDESYD